MKLNPVYLKDLKLNARSAKFSMIIFFYNLCLGLAIILFMYAGMHKEPGNLVFNYENSEQLYSIIAGIELGSIFFFVPALTAGAVCQEREKQTLDFINISRLSPIHIICGKLAYAFTTIMIILISNLPLNSIITITRSIPIRVQWQLLVLLVVTSLYVSCIVLYFSTIKKNTLTAMIWSYAVIFALTVGTIAIYNLNGYVLEDMEINKFNEFNCIYYVFLLNPIATYVYMISSSMQGMVAEWIPTYIQKYWVEFSIFIQLMVSIGLLCLATLHLNSRTVSLKIPFMKKRKTL